MAKRTLYAGQSVQVVTPTNNLTGVFAVQSANCEVTRPVDFVSIFGHNENIAASQNNFTTCKSNIKMYLQKDNSAPLDADFITSLLNDAIYGTPSTIQVSPNGFIMTGILSNLGIDLSVNSFGMADMSFMGIGEPWLDTGAEQYDGEPTNPASPVSIEPVIGTDVSGAITGVGCANSFKFSLDVPNETLGCLGDLITGSQPQLTNSTIIAKLPLKVSVSMEGYGIDISNPNNQDNSNLLYQVTQPFGIGNLMITLPHPKIVSKNFSQTVGNVGAAYSFSVEDTHVLFSDAVSYLFTFGTYDGTVNWGTYPQTFLLDDPPYFQFSLFPKLTRGQMFRGTLKATRDYLSASDCWIAIRSETSPNLWSPNVPYEIPITFASCTGIDFLKFSAEIDVGPGPINCTFEVISGSIETPTKPMAFYYQDSIWYDSLFSYSINSDMLATDLTRYRSNGEGNTIYRTMTAVDKLIDTTDVISGTLRFDHTGASQGWSVDFVDPSTDTIDSNIRTMTVTSGINEYSFNGVSPLDDGRTILVRTTGEAFPMTGTITIVSAELST